MKKEAREARDFALEHIYKKLNQALTEFSFSRFKCQGRSTNLGQLRYSGGPRPRFKNCASRAISFSIFLVTLQPYVPVTATVTIFLKLTAKQEFVPMCCLSRKEDGWRWFQFTGPCPSFWVNFSELRVARG